ncbi:MAG: glycosyltransferase family 4 protein [Cyanobacteria bacterium P01_A01_bin.114]
MKVLFLASEFPPYSGGVGEYAYQVSAKLCKDHNLAVSVLASANHFEADQVSEFDSAFPGPIARYAEMPLFRVKAIYYPLTAVYRLLKSIWVYLRFQPTLVMACDGSSATIAFLMNRLLGARYVIIGHGTEFLRYSRLYAGALEFAAHIIFNSDLTKTFFDQNYQRVKTSHSVVSLGADESVYDLEDLATLAAAGRLRTQLAIDPQTKVVLTVGTVSDRKGQDLVIRALAQLRGQQNSPLIYIVAGRVRDPALLELPRQLGIEDRVKFLNFVDRKDLPALYAFADIYVQPSRLSQKMNSLEGFSISTCEALMMGKPVIVTDSVGIREIVRHNDIGFVVASESVEDMASKISLLEADGGLREGLGEKAFKFARARLTWDSTTQEILEILATVNDPN